MDEVMTMGDVTASTRTAPYSASSSFLPSNAPLLSAFLAFAIAQFLKIFTTWYKERRWDSKRMLDSGGMPSSHSATVSALALAVGLQEGAGSPAFAIAVVLSCILMNFSRGFSNTRIDWAAPPSFLSFYIFLLDPFFPHLEDILSYPHTCCIVMYDASGVRLHAGRQAELLNQIVCELPPEHPLSNVRPLRDSLGHTPLQVVAGGLLGCIIAFLMRSPK